MNFESPNEVESRIYEFRSRHYKDNKSFLETRSFLGGVVGSVTCLAVADFFGAKSEELDPVKLALGLSMTTGLVNSSINFFGDNTREFHIENIAERRARNEFGPNTTLMMSLGVIVGTGVYYAGKSFLKYF